MIIRECLQSESNSDRADKTWLLSAILDCSFSELKLRENEELSPPFLKKFRTAIANRKKGMPLQYCVNSANFWGRNFFVDQRVLIPRPETEILVELALKIGDELSAGVSSFHVFDVGAGSGAIAATIKLERPHWSVAAGDISKAALKVARKNAADLGAEIMFYLQSMLEFKGKSPKIDFLVSNPPYVDFRKDYVAKEVKKFEPSIALEPASIFRTKNSSERGAWIAEEILYSCLAQKIPCALLELSPRIAYGIERKWRKNPAVQKVERFADLAGRKRFLLVRFEHG